MSSHGTTETLLTRFSLIPERIRQVVEGWDTDQLYTSPAQDQWSVVEIFAHLRAVDAIYTHRVYAILVRNQAPLAAFDERRWAEVARYARSDFYTSLAVFTQGRAELVDMLIHIDAQDWQRVGIHEVRGPLTLEALVADWVGHEEEHCTQLEALQQVRK